MKIKFLILFFLLFFSCKKYENGFFIYKIKKGKHYSSGINYSNLTKNKLEFSAMFDNSAIYDLKNQNQLDINKLYGFSDCNSKHHQNSARFGWNWNLLDEKIDIWAYLYNNGVVKYDKLGSINPNETHSYKIELYNDFYLFVFDNQMFWFERTNKCNVGLYYKLFPFFGGNEVAPHDIKIYIKEEN